LVRERIDENWKLRREFTEALDYDSWKRLDETSRLNVKICVEWKCSKFKNLFPENWTEEMIAKSQVKAEKEILDWFGWNMVKELDEAIFENYLKEWWEWDKLGLNDNEKRRAYFERFRNWILNLEFGKFWNNFKRNIIKENWLEIKVWWRYVYKSWRYILSNEVNTLYPNR